MKKGKIFESPKYDNIAQKRPDRIIIRQTINITVFNL